MNGAKSVIQFCVRLFLLLLLVHPNHATAQQQADQRQTTRPGDLNADASRVFTFVEGTGMGHSHGMEAMFSQGRLVLGANEKAGQLVIDMKSFDADTPLARNVVGLKGKSGDWTRKQVAKEMHGSKILHSSEFPTANFDIASCKPLGVAKETGLPSYQLTGTLTLRGVTNPITFPVTVKQEKGWLRVNGRFSFKQSDFGIKPLSKGFGAIGVADQLTVYGDLWIAPTAESLASMQNLLLRR